MKLSRGGSNAQNGSVDPKVGNYAGFRVDLLLENKDGNIYEYNDIIIANRDFFATPYDAVIDKTATENITYRKQSEVKELGSLAADYRSEVKKVEEAEANKETTKASSAVTYGVYMQNEKGEDEKLFEIKVPKKVKTQEEGRSL